MTDITHHINKALEALRAGKTIIVTDDPTRENEGDLMVLADHVTAQNMNFIIRNSSGIVCVSIDQATAARLQLEPMVSAQNNTSLRETPFTVSVDAKDGITTGVSAEDRAQAVRVIAHPQSTADDLVKPGHLFPLVAKPNGVLERQGHTEAAYDLAKLATNDQSTHMVLCELMNADGTMMRGEALHAFATEHQLLIISISELMAYRRLHDNPVQIIATTQLPVEPYGIFECRVFSEKGSDREHLVLSKPNTTDKPTLVRIHSSCMTGDIFNSQRCDCHSQLHYGLQQISQEGGLLIYLNQEGRGIGLGNKIKAYALQSQGIDTVQANLDLGLPADARDYRIAADLLHRDGLTNIRLLTNNPAKVEGLKEQGIATVAREPMPTFSTNHNHDYLKTKRDRLNHLIDLSASQKKGNE